MLNLIKSNWMENLVQALLTMISEVPDTPLAPEYIGIQSRGMKQWLTTAIAQRFGICANVRFLFPRQILEQVLEHTIDNTQELSESRINKAKTVLNPEIMTWSIMDIFVSSSLEACPGFEASGLTRYIMDDPTGKKKLGLSRKIAKVFDDYQVYRPDLLAQWEGEKPLDPVSDSVKDHAVWQAWLWKQLSQRAMSLPDRVDALLTRARAGLLQRDHLPERFSLFGVSSMPPRFLEAFAALAEILDIHLFLLTPCSQFFFDLRSSRQKKEMDLFSDTDGKEDQEGLIPFTDDGNPLLAALGRSGREFHGILENFDYHEPWGDFFTDPLDHEEDRFGLDSGGLPSMLSVVQSDILNLVHRGEKDHPPRAAVSFADRSVSIHACHSPMRESQVLKDLILEAFNTHPELCPHDVIVMMPDIEAYAPFLEAAFSPSPKIPFAVSDRRRRSESSTLEAFLKIFKLKDSRLEKFRVMDLLQSPVIAEKFNLTVADQEQMDKGLTAAGVIWGKDEAHRIQVTGKSYPENTWAFGMRRLALGFAMPGGESELAGEVLPLDGFEGLEGQVFGQYAHFVHTLFDCLGLLDSPKTLENWAACFKRIVRSMMVSDKGYDKDMDFLFTAFEQMAQEGQDAGFKSKIDFSVAREAVESKLDQNISQGSFLAGSMTFCNLMPMRSIPFKLVCLMGMGEKHFPRAHSVNRFDLTHKHPRPGDKNEREEDRYLFLESLLSARQQLIITYTGMSISDNSPIPCAAPVAELEDTLIQSFSFPDGFSWKIFHPLHPFSPVYFDSSGKSPDFFSFSTPQCRIAKAQASQKLNISTGEKQSLCPPGAAGLPALQPLPCGPVFIEILDFIRFYRHPVQAFISRTLGLVYPDLGKERLDREAFQVKGLAQYHLGALCMDQTGDKELFARVRASGTLPFGQKGKTEFDRINGLARPIKSLADEMGARDRVETNNIEFKTGPFEFSGQVGDVFAQGRVVKGFAALTPARILTQWIYHLMYSVMVSDAGYTRLVGKDLKKGSVYCELAPLDQPTAGQIIEDLAQFYLTGQTRVMPFLTRVCFYLAATLKKLNYDQSSPCIEQAFERAKPHWAGNDHLPGECQNRYTALAFQGADPFANSEALKASGLIETGLFVFKPLLENLTL
ncbi:MAG: exodeoxyribonuclease V subunit gamma [Desulfobacter sp.]|nr:MAG: exodeoxyribonuclease V subunit gamma [Desulfobacter sp.]